MSTVKLAFAFVFALTMLPVDAVATGRTCEYDLECPTAHTCGADGLCYRRGELPRQSADDECGADRRCRIDRLAEQRRRARRSRAAAHEASVQHVTDWHKRELRRTAPRKAFPFSAGLRVSRLGAAGGFLGYTLFGRVQPSFEFTYSPSLRRDGYTAEMWWFRLGGSYFLFDGPITPFLTAGFQVGAGSQSDGYTSDAKLVVHAGEVGGGLDVTARFGLMSRLSVVYRPRVYTQAKYGPGSYDDAGRDAIIDWYKRHATVDVVWVLGWAF